MLAFVTIETFLLPFAIGACMAVGGDLTAVVKDAFGVVAMVAMTPLIAIQILGLVYKLKHRKAQKSTVEEPITNEEGQITIDFDVLIADEPEEADDIIDF